MKDGLWIYIEEQKDRVAKSSLEVLSEGRRVARRLGLQTVAVVTGYSGQSREEYITTLGHYGADIVLYVVNENLNPYTTTLYTDVMSELIERHHPNIIFFPGTANGKDLAYRLAARHKTGLISDCTYLKLGENDKLIGTRASYNQRVAFRVTSKDPGLQIVTIPPKIMTVDQPDSSRKADVIQEKVQIDTLMGEVKVIDKIEDIPTEMALSDAEVIVSGGRGLEGEKGIALLQELAEAVGGAIGASRMAVDAGWLPMKALVGQTGSIVSPTLYIACGISGASQHIIGMKDADTIIAINSDRNAPIFNIADIGVVGDLFEVIPAMIEKFRLLKKDKE